MRERRVNLTPRLLTALDMLRGSKVVADIGSDHGKLCAALLQRDICRHVISTDISASSLEKAMNLLRHIGLEKKVEFRVGDGLSVIDYGECDAIALLGMGGTLMRGILEESDAPLKGAQFAVFQPMRAQRDIRSYLYEHCYHITDDRIVSEQGRYYQIFKAEPRTTLQEWPDNFPKDFFDIGFVSFIDRDANLLSLCYQQLAQHKKRMQTAFGTEGETKLSARIKALEQIIRRLQRIEL